MADKKISALTAASTPLAGTEVLPIVQSGATVKVAVSDLTAGRAISATSVTAYTGNFVVGTSGQGVDFSATPNTGTSELLADYEEGTWTGTLTASVTAPSTAQTATGIYTKIGRQVTVIINFDNANTTGAVGNMRVSGLPYAPNATYGTNGVVDSFGLSIPNKTLTTRTIGSNTYVIFYSSADNANWSVVDITAGTSKYLYFTLTYFV
jgi:hypothetical protein